MNLLTCELVSFKRNRARVSHSSTFVYQGIILLQCCVLFVKSVGGQAGSFVGGCVLTFGPVE